MCPCNILMTFIIFGNSSCIIFAVVRSTLLLLHFLLHSLFFRSYLVSLQYFDDFYHIRILKKRLSREVCAIVAVPLGSRMLRIWKGYMAHAVPLVFGANFFLKSTNISLCAMSRLDLVTFWFSVGCRCAIGIVTK